MPYITKAERDATRAEGKQRIRAALIRQDGTVRPIAAVTRYNPDRRSLTDHVSILYADDSGRIHDLTRSLAAALDGHYRRAGQHGLAFGGGGYSKAFEAVSAIAALCGATDPNAVDWADIRL